MGKGGGGVTVFCLGIEMEGRIVGKGGGEDSHMKQTVNFGFWSCLGCSGQSANILSRQGLV